MDQRDDFAKAALVGLLSSQRTIGAHEQLPRLWSADSGTAIFISKESAAVYAKAAYVLADAMTLARKGQSE